MSRSCWILEILALLSAGSAAAQGPVPASQLTPATTSPAPWGPVDSALGAALRVPDSLPCPACNPPKQFWAAFGELMLAQVIPHFVNARVRKAVWADVSLQSIKNNLTYPWQWDDNQFVNNQFSHPYHGNLYFNAARTNGYNFWQSFAWPFAGSLMWELAGEAWAPAPNDFINTSFGGVVLGETFYRLSSLALDNTATGSERTWREIGAALLNPIRGFNRLLRGETHGVSANPPDWRPSNVVGVLDLGYRQTTQSLSNGAGPTGSTQWNATFSLIYGDPTTDLARAPFSYFAVRADLAGPSETGRLSELSARGSLAAWSLGESRRHQVAASLEYDYFNNPAFEYGGQSAQIGLVSTYGEPGGTWWGQTNFLFNGVILGATKSDYYATIEGRNYDYGPGLGTLMNGRFLYKNRLQGSVAYTGLWLHTIDGASSTHYQAALQFEGRYWITGRLGVGASYTGYNRNSHYVGAADVSESTNFVRAFVSTALPRLPQSGAGEQP